MGVSSSTTSDRVPMIINPMIINTSIRTTDLTWCRSRSHNSSFVSDTRVICRSTSYNEEEECIQPDDFHAQCTVVTKQPIREHNNDKFRWDIVIHQHDYHAYIGFIDAPPFIIHNFFHDLNFYHKNVFMNNFWDCKDGDILTFCVDFLAKTVKVLVNGKTHPSHKSEWEFVGNEIYPTVSIADGMAEYSIATLSNKEHNNIVEGLQKLSLEVDNNMLNIFNKKYDDDEKQGYGNTFSDEHDKEDKHTLIITDKYKIQSPNTITWVIKQEFNNFRIDWGIRGSYCGIGVGRKRFIKPETGDFKVLFHFGFMFNGNDYKLTDIDFDSEYPDRHWMSLHRMTKSIGIEICGSKTAACHQLSEVWQTCGEIDSGDYKYYRLNPGFCRTSVRCIAKVVNDEKARKYELFHDANTDWTSKKDLTKYTNCMMFVIRMCKACQMEIPEWKVIIELFDTWEGSDRFEKHWTHFKQYANV